MFSLICLPRTVPSICHPADAASKGKNGTWKVGRGICVARRLLTRGAK
jgi:hypothetical protein